MVEMRLCFAAEGVVRDAESNLISAFNLFEGLSAAGVPFFMQKVSFFAMWQRSEDDAERYQGQFTLALNETNLAQQEVLVEFGRELRTRTIVIVAGLVVPGPGSLRFRFDLQGGPRAEYVVFVQVPPPTVVPAGQPPR
jgi:hypothetical protein